MAPVWGFLVFATPGKAAEAQVLHGHVPAAIAKLNLQPVSRLPSTNRLQLAIGLPLRNQVALDALLQQICDPTSPGFRHYLTPQQFAERFGPTEKDYETLVTLATSHGFIVTSRHPNRTLLSVTASVADVEKALKVTMRVYQHPTEARTFYAPDVEPSVTAAIPILGISGLSDFSRPRPRVEVLSADRQQAQPNSGSGPGGAYMGKDFRAAYVPGSSLTGSGQIVGLLQFDGYTAGDIAYYESLNGLPSVTLSNVLLDGFTGAPSGGNGSVEVSLDIEMAISMAPGLSKVIVYEGGPFGNWHDILNRMVTDNLAKQLSCSWYSPGGTADPIADQIFQQMAAQGQSFFSASGDDDAFTGLIPFPGDTPYITQVGGTTLNTTGPGGAWVSETVWNWGNGIGSGGGISTQYSIPTWQATVNMQAGHGSTIQRNIPDIALTADNVYVRANGGDNNVGGTSCAAPLWAGFTALVNQQAIASGGPPVGFINPAVYTLGQSTNYSNCFHDITTGNNESSSSPTNFVAVAGYDLCTGWGTPTGTNLIYALAGTGLQPVLLAAGTVISGGNGNGVVDINECDQISLLLQNFGATASNVTATITTPTVGVSVTQPYSVYPDLGPGGTMANTTPFEICTTNSAYICGTPVTLTLQVNYTGGSNTLSYSLTNGPCPPVAGFTATPTNGPTPVTVNFTDTSGGTITNRFWTFGDGATTTALTGSMQHTYTAVGTDTVTLIVSGPLGSSTNVQPNLITIVPGALDHFAWSSIASPQTQYTPFPVTITAQDAGNDTMTNFTGTVALSGFSGKTGTGAALTFDDLAGDDSPVPAGYGNLTWNNFNYLNGFAHPNSGYFAGTISPSNVVFNAYGTPASIASTGLFNLVSAYLTAAWNDNLQVQVLGYNGGTLLYNNSYALSATAPTLITFNYLGVNMVDFISSGGTPHPGYTGRGTHFVMDNVVFGVNLATPASITPTNSGNFVGGVWTGAVTVLQGASSMSLLAQDGSGHSGTSTTFSVTVNVPILGVTPASYAFGILLTGTIAQASFTITNGGTSLLTGTASGASGPFTIVSGSPYSVPSNGSGTVVVQFAPTGLGTYSNSLIFASNGGYSTNLVTGTGGALPVANFTAAPTNGLAPLTVTFGDSSSGAITNRSWLFGDGAATNTLAFNVSHTYTSAGTNTVTLTVTGPFGSSSLTRTNAIIVMAVTSNSWINAGSDKWEVAGNWSDGVPNIAQPALYITNANSKTVIIDAVTTNTPSCLTISNLTVVGSASTTNTLSLNNIGSTIPLQTFSSGRGLTLDTNASVVVNNSALVVANNGSLTVGDSGAACSLLITNKGNVSVKWCYLGNNAGSSNNLVLVDGPGSTWSSYYSLIVGASGSGNALVITNQGSFFDNTCILGQNLNSSGNLAVVNGPGSTWTNTYLYVGYHGSGARLTIANGGHVVGVYNYLGFGSNTGLPGNNLAVVSDTGSVWNASNLYVGYSGDTFYGNGNTLVVTNGGAVISSIGYLSYENAGTSNMNVALVTGPGSLWNSTTLYVGGDGSGNQLLVGGGGAVVSSVGYIGYSSTIGCSNNLAVVSDPGSIWSNSALYVGYGTFSCSDNQLVLTNGGTVFASNMVVGAGSLASNNLVKIESGTLRVPGGNGRGGLILGQTGQGRLLLDDGTVTVNQLVLTNGVNSVVTFNGGTLSSGGTFVTNNQLFAVGAGTNAATFQLNGGVHSFANNLEILNNATLSGCGTVTGNVVVDPGGTVLANCGGTLTFTGIVTNNGSMHPINGSVVEFYGTMVNNGTIDITAGTTNFHGTFINNGTIITPPAPVAGFSANKTNGVVSLNVSFTNTSTGVIWGYHWDFGDGNTSTARNPGHSYTTGVYTVQLIVNGPGGVTTNTKPNYITVLPVRSTIGFDVGYLYDRFGTLASTDSVAVLVVDVGTNGLVDPQPDSPLGLDASWGAGNRIIGLWDLNGCGCGDGWLYDQTIVAYTNGVAPGQKLQLYWFPSLTLASNTVGITYYGKFADTNNPPLSGGDAWKIPVGGSSVQLDYYSAGIGGTYPETNGFATLFTIVPSSAVFTASPTNGVAPLAVAFTDTSTGTISNRFWDFGDGGTTNTTTNSVAHSYAAGGYTVTLVVSGLGGVSTNTQPDYINVLTPFQQWQINYFGCTNCPQAAPGADPLGKGTSNLTEFLAGIDPTNSAARWIIHASPSNGVAPLTVKFTENSTGSSITNRLWDFGDGSIISGTNPSHTYPGPGTFSVSLTIFTVNGVATLVASNLVTVMPAPSTITVDAGYLYDRDGILMPTNRVAVLVVDMGTNGFVDPQPPFPLKLGATWGTEDRIVGLWDLGGCSDCGVGYLNDQTVVAYTNGIVPGQKLQLYWFPSLTLASNTVGVTYYGKYRDTNSPPLEAGTDEWQVPAGASSAYLAFYTVATGGLSPETDGVAPFFTAVPPSAVFTASPTNGVAPLVVTFTDASTGTIYNRFWDFGDGNTAYTTATNISHTYGAGVHTVILIVSGPAGVSTNIQSNVITVVTPFAVWQMQYFGCTNCPQAAPDADPLGKGMSNLTEFLAGIDPTNSVSRWIIHASPNNGPLPLPVSFAENSTGSSITNRFWDFGDGGTVSGTNPSHTYTNAGTFSVSLTIFTVNGATTLVASNLVTVTLAPSTVTVDAGYLYDKDGILMPTNRVAVLVADMGTNGFVDPQPAFPLKPGAMWGAENRIVGLWDLTGCSDCGAGYLYDQTVVGYTNGIAPSQKLQLYWFPSLTLASNTVGVTYYGKCRDTNSPPLEAGTDAWQMPEGGSSAYLAFYTVAAGGSSSETDGLAPFFTAVSPAAAFTVSPTNGVAPLVVTFADASTGTISNWFWDFGDGNTSNTTATSLSHSYDAGVYTVTLIASGPAGISTNIQSTIITVLTPFAAWQMQYFGCTNCPQAAANADPLGKGMSNTNQFLAGLNPTNSASVFRITTVVPQGDDVAITWTTAGGRTNAVQATAGDVSGGYATNFIDLSGLFVISGSGDTSTNYLDLGGATNGSARFYRVRLVP